MTQGKAKKELVITTIRVPRDFWGKVRARAFEEGLSAGQLILKVLAEYLKREGRN